MYTSTKHRCSFALSCWHTSDVAHSLTKSLTSKWRKLFLYKKTQYFLVWKIKTAFLVCTQNIFLSLNRTHGLICYMKEEICSLFEEDTYNNSLCKALNVLAKQLVNVRKQKTRTYSAQSKVTYFHVSLLAVFYSTSWRLGSRWDFDSKIILAIK